MHAKLTVLAVAGLIGTLTSITQAATVDKQKLTGASVGTSFSAEAAITCSDGTQGSVFATGFLMGSQSIVKETGAKTFNNGIYVEIDSYSDSCTGTTLGFASGGISDAFTPPNTNLDSSRFTGTTSVQDFGSGASVVVALNIAITGTGVISTSAGKTKTKTVQDSNGPATISINRSAFSSRDGTASGTITIDGVVLRPTFSVTSLFRSSSATITITKKSG
jgi:hypothetical protein